MPKIPLYNKGFGPTVRSPVGQLGSTLSSAPFEAAAEGSFAPLQSAIKFVDKEAQRRADEEVLARAEAEQEAEIGRRSMAQAGLVGAAATAARLKRLEAEQKLGDEETQALVNQGLASRARAVMVGAAAQNLLSESADATNSQGIQNSFSEQLDQFMIESPVAGIENQKTQVKGFTDNFISQLKTNPAFNKLSPTAQNELIQKINIEALVSHTGNMSQAHAREDALKIQVANDAIQLINKRVDRGTITFDEAQSELITLLERAEDDGISDSFESLEFYLFGAAEDYEINFSRTDGLSLSDLRDRKSAVASDTGPYAMLSEARRATLESIYTAKIQTVQTVDAAKVTGQLENALATAANSTDVAEITAAISQIRFSAAELEAMGLKAQAGAAMASADGLQMARSYEAKFGLSSLSERQAELNRITSSLDNELGTDNAANAMQQKKLIIEQYNKMSEAMANDPAAYVASITARRGEEPITAEENIKLQALIGIPDSKVTPFTLGQFDELTVALDTGDSQEKLDALRSFFGQFSNSNTQDKAMGRAVSMGLTPAQNLALWVDSKGVNGSNAGQAKLLLDSNSIDPELTKSFFKDDSHDQSKIAAAVVTALEDYRVSVLGSGVRYGDNPAASGARFNAFDGGVQQSIVQVAEYIYQKNGGKVNESVAAQRASDIILSQYHIKKEFPGRARESNSTVRVPVHFGEGYAQDLVDKLAELRTSKEFITYLGFTPSPTGAFAGVSEENRMESYILSIQKGSGWSTTDDDSGVILRDEFGNPVLRMIDAEGEPLSRGIPVAYTWAELEGLKVPKRVRTMSVVETKSGKLQSSVLPIILPD